MLAVGAQRALQRVSGSQETPSRTRARREYTGSEWDRPLGALELEPLLWVLWLIASALPGKPEWLRAFADTRNLAPLLVRGSPWTGMSSGNRYLMAWNSCVAMAG